MFLPTYTISSMSLPKYQADEDYGYVIDILDHKETQVCHIENSLYDKTRKSLPVSPYSPPQYNLTDDYILVFAEEGRMNESYMTKAKKTCSEFIRKLWKK